MVLRRDLDLARQQVLYGVVGAVVAELELVGLAAERQADNLVPEADAEDRHAPGEFAHRFNRIRTRLGVARAVREKDAVGLEREHVLGRRERRHDRDPAADVHQPPQDVLLDTEIISGHMEARRRGLDAAARQLHARLRPLVALFGGDGPGEVEPDHRRQRARLRHQRRRIGRNRREHGALGAVGAQVADERARVNVAEDRDVVPGEEIFGGLAAAPVGGELGEVAHDECFDVGPPGLVVEGVGADVADVRVGQADELPGVGRVGEDFLVAGDGGIENDFPAALAARAVAAALKEPAVLQGEDCFHPLSQSSRAPRYSSPLALSITPKRSGGQ